MITLRQAYRARAGAGARSAVALRGLALGFAALAAAAVAGLLIGPAHLSARDVLAELFGSSRLSDRDAAILWQLRMPRVVLGGLVGATLAAAGAAYQGVFRNPLADPYLLGSASGAALGATLAIAAGQPASGPIVPIAAFLGALGGVAMAYTLGRSVKGGSRTGTLILAGVAVASFLTALQTFVQQRDQETFRGVVRWILGGLATTGWKEVGLILPYAVVSAAALILHRRLLDVMSVGDDESASLGISAARVRLWVVGAASLGTAAAVAAGGLIGFVGIVVPHTVRLLAGSSYRLVLPLSLVFGAAFLMFADLLARTVVAPAELPIGVVTAFFGAPFFAIVLRRGAKS